MGAQGYVRLLEHAYEALLYHRINYRDLPEYKDSRLLDEARKLEPSRASSKYLLWIERVYNAVDAAIRRKQFVLHHTDRKD